MLLGRTVTKCTKCTTPRHGGAKNRTPVTAPATGARSRSRSRTLSIVNCHEKVKSYCNIAFWSQVRTGREGIERRVSDLQHSTIVDWFYDLIVIYCRSAGVTQVVVPSGTSADLCSGAAGGGERSRPSRMLSNAAPLPSDAVVVGYSSVVSRLL